MFPCCVWGRVCDLPSAAALCQEALSFALRGAADNERARLRYRRRLHGPHVEKSGFGKTLRTASNAGHASRGRRGRTTAGSEILRDPERPDPCAEGNEIRAPERMHCARKQHSWAFGTVEKSAGFSGCEISRGTAQCAPKPPQNLVMEVYELSAPCAGSYPSRYAAGVGFVSNGTQHVAPGSTCARVDAHDATRMLRYVCGTPSPTPLKPSLPECEVVRDALWAASLAHSLCKIRHSFWAFASMRRFSPTQIDLPFRDKSDVSDVAA